jgi:hypothetical protein
LIVNTASKSLYDAREEDMQQMTENLIHFVNASSTSNNDPESAFNTNIKVYNYSFVNKFELVKYSQLFAFYLTNDYLEMSSKDLVILSSWLNEQWNLILKSKTLSFVYFRLMFYLIGLVF